MEKGFAGKIASFFLQSKLTVLLMGIFLLIGIYSSFLIPREEEPQIEVPIADVFVGYPGASPLEVESKVAKPLEKIISNLPGVEYVYSTSMKGQAMLIVQFYVGEDIERSFVQLYNEIIKHRNTSTSSATRNTTLSEMRCKRATRATDAHNQKPVRLVMRLAPRSKSEGRPSSDRP